jgi:hypothetical protein
MRLTREELEEYRLALRDRVCAACRSCGYGDSCKVLPDGLCPIELHLPYLVEAVLSTPPSASISAYLPAIRTLVCSRCPNQDATGYCRAREAAACGLDSFLVLAVGTIEEVRERLERERLERERLERERLERERSRSACRAAAPRSTNRRGCEPIYCAGPAQLSGG